jgi:hypothetical protein
LTDVAFVDAVEVRLCGVVAMSVVSVVLAVTVPFTDTVFVTIVLTAISASPIGFIPAISTEDIGFSVADAKWTHTSVRLITRPPVGVDAIFGRVTPVIGRRVRVAVTLSITTYACS